MNNHELLEDIQLWKAKVKLWRDGTPPAETPELTRNRLIALVGEAYGLILRIEKILIQRHPIFWP